jgi:hypothetical protein
MKHFPINRTKIIALILLCLPFFSFAQTPGVLTEEPVNENFAADAQIPISNIIVENAGIIGRVENQIQAKFTMSSSRGAQSDIKYGLLVLKNTKLGQVIEDQVVFDEVISLSEGMPQDRVVDYPFPDYLSGEYSILLEVTNTAGFMLSLNYLGHITKSDASEGIYISSDSCYLTVDEDKALRYQSLNETDITSEEKLYGHCKVKNKLEQDKALILRLDQYKGSVYGEKLGNSKEIKLNLESGEEKEISFEIPKHDSSGIYYASVFIEDPSTKKYSNEVKFNYVLRGPIVSILNLYLDKDYYYRGETAEVVYLWSPILKNSPALDERLDPRHGPIQISPRQSSKIVIKDARGINCAKEAVFNLDQKQDLNIYSNNIKITRKCKDPMVTLSIIDEDGTILDERNFNFLSNSFKSDSYLYMYISALFLIVLAFLLYRLKTKRVIIPIAMFALLVVPGAQAASYSCSPQYSYYYNQTRFGTDNIYTVSGISQKEYVVGEKIYVSGSAPKGTMLSVSYGGQVKVLAINAGKYPTFYGSTEIELKEGDNQSIVFIGQTVDACSHIQLADGSIQSLADYYLGKPYPRTPSGLTSWGSPWTSRRTDYNYFQKINVKVPPAYVGIDISLRVKKGDKIYPVIAVPTTDPGASPMRINYKGKIWALKGEVVR